MVNNARVVLGTAQWGLPYGVANTSGKPSVSDVARLVGVARESGICVIDTARAYGDSEEVIGAVVGDDAAWRVITKLAPDVDEGVTHADEVVARVDASIAASHRALRRDRLDTVLLHRARHRTAFGGAVWRRLLDMKARGDIGLVGVSAGTPDEAWAAIAAGVDVVQVAASLADQRLYRAGFFDDARARGVEVFVRSAYLQGALVATTPLPPRLSSLSAWARAVRADVEARGVAFVDVLIAVVESVFGGRPVVGTETVAQVRALVSREAVDADLVRTLVDAAPVFAEDVLDPSRWQGAA